MENIKRSPQELERWSFLWSEVRLVIAAFALFLGGVPPIYRILPVAGLFGIEGFLVRLCWIVSGVAAAYLLYRWNATGQKVFGGKQTKDVVAFFVSVVSGLNLGIAGLISVNIGMRIAAGAVIFIIVGLVYLAAAWQLYTRWKASGKNLF